MNTRKVFLVAKREFIRTVRKPSFWIATLLFPAFIGIVSFVSGYSAGEATKQAEKDIQEADEIVIVDEAGILNPAIFENEVYRQVASSEVEESKQGVIAGDLDALIIYPEDLYSEQTIEIYQPYKGLFSAGRFEEMARQLLNQSIIQEIGDPQKIALFNERVEANTINYENGEPVDLNIEQFIFPAVAVVLYFLLVFLANNYLLMSVSEEKENRMIEIVLSTITSGELISGKILGLAGVALAQVGLLLLLGGAVVFYSTTQLPIEINFAAIEWDVLQIFASLFYMLSGFLIMASIMVGVGAVMPTYKEAQSFSSVFVIASIFPMYFASLILADPQGTIALITSYFPLTASLVLLARNALGELPLWELGLSSILLVGYVIGGFVLAFKLFELGALEYTEKLGFKEIFNRLRGSHR